MPSNAYVPLEERVCIGCGGTVATGATFARKGGARAKGWRTRCRACEAIRLRELRAKRRDELAAAPSSPPVTASEASLRRARLYRRNARRDRELANWIDDSMCVARLHRSARLGIARGPTRGGHRPRRR